MKDPLETILQQTGLNNSYFQPSSRYYGIETSVLEGKDRKKKVYVKRRFIAQPETYELVQEHRVKQDDRLDNIANQYLGDPEQFWRVCDANAAMVPNQLTDTVGNNIKITLPSGISVSK